MVKRPKTALIAAAICLVGFAATGAIALWSPFAQAHDSATLNGFMALSHTRAAGYADAFARLVDPPGVIVFVIVIAAIALLRGRPRIALGVPLMIVAAVSSAELLKPLIAASRNVDWLTAGAKVHAGSWPSGHATAAMAVALGGVIVAPRALRPLAAALGTVLAVGVSYSVLLLSWHFPSDVLGGLLLAAIWTSATVAALWWADERWPARAGRRAVSRTFGASLAPAAAVVAILAAAIALFISRGELAGAAEVAPASFTTAAIGIAAVAGTIAAGLAFALRR